MFYMSYLTILCRLKDIPAEIQKKTLSGKSKVIFFLGESSWCTYKGKKCYFVCCYRAGEAVTRSNPHDLSSKGNTTLNKTTVNTFFIINLLHDNDKHIYS